MYACYFDGSEFNDKNINYTTTLPFSYESCNIYTHEWIHATEKKENKNELNGTGWDETETSQVKYKKTHRRHTILIFSEFLVVKKLLNLCCLGREKGTITATTYLPHLAKKNYKIKQSAFHLKPTTIHFIACPYMYTLYTMPLFSSTHEITKKWRFSLSINKALVNWNTYKSTVVWC